MRSILLMLSIVCASNPVLSLPRQRHETIVGRLVAYSTQPACVNGNGYWAMVIRVQRPKNIQTKFIRVDFSLPCDKSPEWVSAEASVRKFRLYRQKDCDAVLEEFAGTEPKQNLVISDLEIYS